MRILIVSDIHANWAALQTIPTQCDVCLFLGDLVDYGPDPVPCMDWVKNHATYCIRGNHDHAATQMIATQGTTGFRYLTAVTRPLTLQTLTAEHRKFLGDFPVTRFLTLNNKRFMLCHATPWDPMEEYAPPDVDFWQPRVEGLNVDFLLVGHTHIPYILQVGNTTVINPGSVGLPRDGDIRTAYAIIEDNEATLHRHDYPVNITIEQMKQSPLPDLAKSMLEEVYTTGKLKLRG
jgi:putative phosphoesterase